MNECLYILLVAILSVLLWLASHILTSPPCTPFIMVFSADENSTLGVVGTIFLCVLLSFTCISLILIAWDTCRPSPPNRRSRYLEFDPVEQEDRHTAENNR